MRPRGGVSALHKLLSRRSAKAHMKDAGEAVRSLLRWSFELAAEASTGVAAIDAFICVREHRFPSVGSAHPRSSDQAPVILSPQPSYKLNRNGQEEDSDH